MRKGLLAGAAAMTLTLAFAPASRAADVTFSNPAPIVLNDNAPATPYPSSIAISGLAGAVTKATAHVEGITHDFPDDIDMLLAGPGGQSVVLMSDACQQDTWASADETFDDSGPIRPLIDPCFDGFYRPTNYVAGDPFPAPAPNPPSADALAVFNGTSPEGIWSLYALDDKAFGAGRISGGWSLTLSGTRSKLRCGGKPATIVGTPGRDTLRGSKRRDVMIGLGGKDTLVGRGGNDLICGNGGHNRLFGGPGEDRLIGGPKNDRIAGGQGRDVLVGRGANDLLSGGPGPDKLKGGKGKGDRCKGGGGNDKGKGCEKGRI